MRVPWGLSRFRIKYTAQSPQMNINGMRAGCRVSRGNRKSAALSGRPYTTKQERDKRPCSHRMATIAGMQRLTLVVMESSDINTGRQEMNCGSH